MNARALSLPAPLATLRERSSASWQRLTPRDRRVAKVAATVVGLALLWALAVQPALRTLAEAPPAIDRLDAELQQMQMLAAESRSLRAAPAVAPAQAAAALKVAVARLGERGRLTQQGERAIVNLSGVDGETLRGLLAEARAAARARPIEAQLTRSAKGYDGTLVLGLGSAP